LIFGIEFLEKYNSGDSSPNPDATNNSASVDSKSGNLKRSYEQMDLVGLCNTSTQPSISPTFSPDTIESWNSPNSRLPDSLELRCYRDQQIHLQHPLPNSIPSMASANGLCAPTFFTRSCNISNNASFTWSFSKSPTASSNCIRSVEAWMGFGDIFFQCGRIDFNLCENHIWHISNATPW
jgi:hypothetical protein